MLPKCYTCGSVPGFLGGPLVEFQSKEYCRKCAEGAIDEASSVVMVTTTHNFDGYRVQRYIEIESVEIVIGTGIFSEITGEFSDFFGSRSSAFEKKLTRAKEVAFKKLKYQAFMKGGNAVIGIDMDYTEFSGNRIGLIVNGTIVELEKCSQNTRGK
ncbi:MAG: heavy metal-binding domain-containing protein [Deltaproteobacteria bacterium]|nr:heavy metal-binding domain-containing protein [Deltaproteobacteria bacterium]